MSEYKRAIDRMTFVCPCCGHEISAKIREQWTKQNRRKGYTMSESAVQARKASIAKAVEASHTLEAKSKRQLSVVKTWARKRQRREALAKARAARPSAE